MNVLKSMFDGAWDSIKSPSKVLENVAKGDFSEAFKDLKHMPGNQERANTDILNSFGIRGWVGDSPGEIAGGIAAAIFGGAALAGGSAAGVGGSGAALGGSTGASSALAYTPTASSVLAGSGGSGASALAYTPSTSSVLSGTGATGIIEGAGTSALTYAPTQSTLLGGTGSGIAPDFGAGLSPNLGSMFSQGDLEMAQKIAGNIRGGGQKTESFSSMARSNAPSISSGQSKGIFTGNDQGITNRIHGQFSPTNTNLSGNPNNGLAPQQRYLNI